MNLTPHFTLEELTITSVHAKNEPTLLQIENLRQVAYILEYIRAKLGCPIHINSGFRSKVVNTTVGGSKTSSHMDGLAVDFIVPQYGTPLQICKLLASDKDFIGKIDQVIEEGTWVHVGIGPKMRHQVLTKTPTGYSTGLTNS